MVRQMLSRRGVLRLLAMIPGLGFLANLPAVASEVPVDEASGDRVTMLGVTLHRDQLSYFGDKELRDEVGRKLRRLIDGGIRVGEMNGEAKSDPRFCNCVLSVTGRVAEDLATGRGERLIDVLVGIAFDGLKKSKSSL